MSKRLQTYLKRPSGEGLARKSNEPSIPKSNSSPKRARNELAAVNKKKKKNDKKTNHTTQSSSSSSSPTRNSTPSKRVKYDVAIEKNDNTSMNAYVSRRQYLFPACARMVGAKYKVRYCSALNPDDDVHVVDVKKSTQRLFTEKLIPKPGYEACFQYMGRNRGAAVQRGAWYSCQVKSVQQDKRTCVVESDGETFPNIPFEQVALLACPTRKATVDRYKVVVVPPAKPLSSSPTKSQKSPMEIDKVKKKSNTPSRTAASSPAAKRSSSPPLLQPLPPNELITVLSRLPPIPPPPPSLKRLLLDTSLSDVNVYHLVQ